MSFNILCLFSFSYTFASGSPDNIKQWKFPDGNFIQNLSGHNAIINTLAVNSDGVLVSGGKNEKYTFLSSPLCTYGWRSLGRDAHGAPLYLGLTGCCRTPFHFVVGRATFMTLDVSELHANKINSKDF